MEVDRQRLPPDRVVVVLVEAGLGAAPGRQHQRVHRRQRGQRGVERGQAQADVEAAIYAGIPIGRMVSADECAALIAWLASPEAAAVTGEAYNISGGEFFA